MDTGLVQLLRAKQNRQTRRGAAGTRSRSAGCNRQASRRLDPGGSSAAVGTEQDARFEATPPRAAASVGNVVLAGKADAQTSMRTDTWSRPRESERRRRWIDIWRSWYALCTQRTDISSLSVTANLGRLALRVSEGGTWCSLSGPFGGDDRERNHGLAGRRGDAPEGRAQVQKAAGQRRVRRCCVVTAEVTGCCVHVSIGHLFGRAGLYLCITN